MVSVGAELGHSACAALPATTPRRQPRSQCSILGGLRRQETRTGYSPRWRPTNPPAFRNESELLAGRSRLLQRTVHVDTVTLPGLHAAEPPGTMPMRHSDCRGQPSNSRTRLEAACQAAAPTKYTRVRTTSVVYFVSPVSS